MQLKDSTLLLRASLGFVFLWFGIDKLIHTSYWFMWVPKYISSSIESSIGQGGFYSIVMGMGVFEAAIGAALIGGVYVRTASLLASAFLALTVVSLGVVPVLRDVGLLGMSVYLYLLPDSNERKISKSSLTLVALLAMAAFAASFASGSASPPMATGQIAGAENEILSITYPFEGSEVTSGPLEIVVDVKAEPKQIGANHVHIKLDGNVIDAIYIQKAGEVKSTVKVVSGSHEISAYIALIDHREIGISSSIKFKVS